MSKKNSKKTVPELRFRGFTDPWEQRQLGEVGSATSGVGFPDAEQGGTDGLPFYKVSDMNLSGNESVMSASSNYVSAEQVVKNHWKPIATVPAIIFAKVGAAVFLDRKRVAAAPFLMDNNMMAYIPDGKSWAVDFCLSVFNRIRLSNLARIGALPSINASDVEQHHIALPGLPEQRLIGRFFSTLDSLIAAAERQEALLRQNKQAYLQLIFPREGETEPRLRFAGFSGEWETQRFGEIFQYERPDAYLADDDEIEDEGAIPVLTANKAFILGYTNSLQGIYRKGRCIIFDDFTLDSKRVDQPFKVRSSAIKILTVRENEDFDFAFELLRTSKFPLLGHARHYIAVVQPQATLIPHSLQEQQHIGRFFRNFDSLIACAEKRVASLRTLKSAYLQRMFV